MSKFLRGLEKIAEEEGYEYAGYAGTDGPRGGPGSGHHVFIHRGSGAVMRTASTPQSESQALKYARANFRNAAKRTDSKASLFRQWLLKRYKIGRNGSKVVDVDQAELASSFNKEHPDLEPINTTHIGVMFGQDPMFERLDTKNIGQHKYLTTVRISGPAYGLVKEPEAPTIAEDPCGATFLTPDKGIAVCVLAKGHEGLHYDSFRKARWAEGSGAVMPELSSQPVIDPVAKQATMALPKMAEQLAAAGPTQTPAPPVLEPMAEPVSVGGMTLSEDLAAQLREALGVPDAAIAAESKDAAIQALVEAQNALQKALDLIQGVVAAAPSRRGRKRESTPKQGELGPVQTARLDAIKAAVASGELPARFIVADVVALLDLREGQAVSTLAHGHSAGYVVRRVAPSTYEVR